MTGFITTPSTPPGVPTRSRAVSVFPKRSTNLVADPLVRPVNSG
ncbi:hypothetical protein [Streptomyces mirabilis]